MSVVGRCLRDPSARWGGDKHGDGASAPLRPWPGAIGLGAVFGGLIALVSTVAIGNAWATCDVGNGPPPTE